MPLSSKASVFENANPDESPFPKLKPVGKKSVTGSEPADPASKPKEADSKRSSIAMKAGLFGEAKATKPPVQLKKTESPATNLLPTNKEPLSPLTPAPVKRIIPELKGPREEADVLPPEERLKIHRESIANMTDAPQRIVPQLKGENDNPDILPPEERRRIASLRMQETSGERVIPKLVSDKDDLSILPPEERRRIAREKQQQQENRSRGGSMISQASKQSSTKGIPSVSSKHSKATPIPTPTQVPARSPATMSIKSPLQVEPKSPLFPAGECENCSNRQQQIDELEGRNYNLEREVQTKDEKIGVLEKKVTAEKDAAAKEKKKSKEELAKKDKKIKALEHDLREAQRMAARRGSDSSAGGGHMAELLAQRDATISQLQKQVETQQLQLEAMDNDEDFSQAQSDAGSTEDEVGVLNSQIWALETACEFRMREINRLNQTLQDFVSQVDKLDKELAEAMRKILEGAKTTQKEEEKAVFGASIDEVVSDFKQKRAEVKTKRRRRPRKGALSRENAELRDELATLKEEMVTMRAAMASKNPHLFIQAMGKASGPQQLYGGPPAAGASQKNCCFTAAFIAAGQAEAQIETLKGHYKREQDRCSQLESMLNKARNAIVSSAGVGYENEIKLQQAKKALQCIIDAPDDQPKSTTAASPVGATSPIPNIANLPSTAQIAHMASTHSSVFERREKSNCIHVRSISPTRNAAWITAPPRPVWG